MSFKRALRDLIVVTFITFIGFSLAYMYFFGRGRLTNSYVDVVDPLGSQLFVIQRVIDLPRFLESSLAPPEVPTNIQMAYFLQLPDQNWEQSLAKVLTHLKSLEFIPATFISITAYTKGMENKIVRHLKEGPQQARIFFHSPHENVAREIHRELPAAQLVVSRAEASRLYLMSQIRLESLPKLEGQIFWADFIQEESLFSLNLLSELKKRRVPALFGPANNEAQWRRLIDLKVSGIITDNAPQLISWLKTQQNQ